MVLQKFCFDTKANPNTEQAWFTRFTELVFAVDTKPYGWDLEESNPLV